MFLTIKIHILPGKPCEFSDISAVSSLGEGNALFLTENKREDSSPERNNRKYKKEESKKDIKRKERIERTKKQPMLHKNRPSKNSLRGIRKG